MASPPRALDGAALERAIRGLHEPAFRWAMTCCAYRRDEAEDVLQTTYLKILDGRARFSGEASFKTWLFSVVRNTALDRRRHGRRWLAWLAGLRAEPAPMPTSPPHDDEPGAAQDRRARVVAALSQLAARQREVIELVFFHDLTLDEAAAVMAVAPGTARIHYDRGKRRLKELLS